MCLKEQLIIEKGTLTRLGAEMLTQLNCCAAHHNFKEIFMPSYLGIFSHISALRLSFVSLPSSPE